MKHLRSLCLFSALLFTFVLPPIAPAADLSITAANFKAGAGAKFITGIAGATVTAGQPVAISPATGRFVLADGNDEQLSEVAGVAAHASINGAPLAVVWYADNMTLGATFDMSYPVYALSATAGGICPVSDLGAGGIFPNVIIVANSTTTCKFRAPSGLKGSAVTVAD